MSDQPKKPGKPEISEEDVKLLLQSDAHALVKVLGVAAEVLAPIHRQYLANEAAKTPEQRAREARAREVDAARREQEKEAQRAAKRLGLYKKWCLRDTWLLEDEAIPLTLESEPSWLLPIIEGADELLVLAKSCVGYSLNIKNAADAPGKWRVTPAEWVRWLNEKNYPVNAELEAATRPKVPEIAQSNEPKTAKATQSRERRKAERIRALKSFLDDMEQRARRRNFIWDRTGIPATKKDFRAEFARHHPQYRELSLASYDNDFDQLGVRFKPGVRANKNNMLKLLFASC